MPIQRNGPSPGKVFIQVELKANLGNYESAGFSVGYEVPGDSDLREVREKIRRELFDTGKFFLAGYDLPTVGPKAAGQVALSLKKGNS